MTVLLPQRTTSQIGLAGAATDEPPPVLYLLHGMSDDATTWVRRTSIERYVAPLGLAVVMPQVHRSYYTDEVYGGRFWTFLTEELPRLVHDFFRVSERREDTFVAGLSMGGYGAFKWALREPHRFAAAASLSGALDVAGRTTRRERPEDPRMTAAALRRRAGRGQRRRPDASRRAADPAALPAMRAWCGHEDGLLADNRRFAAACADAGLPVELRRGAGRPRLGLLGRPDRRRARLAAARATRPSRLEVEAWSQSGRTSSRAYAGPRPPSPRRPSARRAAGRPRPRRPGPSSTAAASATRPRLGAEGLADHRDLAGVDGGAAPQSQRRAVPAGRAKPSSSSSRGCTAIAGAAARPRGRPRRCGPAASPAPASAVTPSSARRSASPSAMAETARVAGHGVRLLDAERRLEQAGQLRGRRPARQALEHPVDVVGSLHLRQPQPGPRRAPASIARSASCHGVPAPLGGRPPASARHRSSSSATACARQLLARRGRRRPPGRG